MEIKKFYKNKKVLVTGATGFKGAWLCYWLKILGANVYGIGHKLNKNKNLFNSLKLKKKIKLKLLDITDKKKLKLFILNSKPEIIFHLAAQPLILESYKEPYETFTVNSFGTLNLLDIVKNVRFVKSLVCITSDKCYENNNSTTGFKENDRLGGEDPYSASKATAELMIRSYSESFFIKTGCGIASARAGNVIGGGDWSSNRLIPDTIISLMSNKLIKIRNPHFNRPWQHVLEPIYGYLLLAKKLYFNPKKFSGPWNFGTEKNTVTSVKKIALYILKLWGGGNLKIKNKQSYYEQTNLQLNIEKSKKILKWKPKFTIYKSVKITVEWYKQVLIYKTDPETITKNQITDYMNEIK